MAARISPRAIDATSHIIPSLHRQEPEIGLLAPEPRVIFRIRGKPMDRKTIEDDAIVERYVTGKLSEDEAARFEEYFLEHPECAAWVEDAERLHRGLKVVAAQQAMKFSLLAAAARRLRSGSLRVALPVLGLALMTFLLGMQMRRISQLEHSLARSAAARANPTLIDLGIMRSSGSPLDLGQIISLPAEPEWLILTLDLPEAGDGPYQAQLIDASNRELLLVPGLEPDAAGRLVLGISSTSLQPGNATLQITRASTGQAPVADPPSPVASISLHLVSRAGD